MPKKIQWGLSQYRLGGKLVLVATTGTAAMSLVWWAAYWQQSVVFQAVLALLSLFVFFAVIYGVYRNVACAVARLIAAMEQAAQKLRAERQCARHISLHIATSRFGNQPYYANQTSTRLVVPTNDTRALLGLISPLLDGIWQEGHRYSKAGVMLTDFSSVEHQQGDLFAAEPQDPRRAALMQVVDSINSKGRFGKLFFGATGGLKHDWDVKRESLSPRYTTNLADLPKART